MVKKLVKHEIIAYMRTMLPMQLILLGIAVLVRFVQLFESDITAFNIVNISSIIAFVISIIVCLVMAVVVSITRFYKNLFTSEGYLSFTLPVTPAAHIFAKLLVSVMFFAITVVTVLLSLCVATLGDVLTEVIKAIGYLAREFYDSVGVHMVFYILEIIIGAVVLFSASYLKFYACISLGQMAKKNRILAAFGVYFGYYFICQIIATIFIIIINNIYDYLPFDVIYRFIDKYPYGSAHIMLWMVILFYAGISAVYFLVSHCVIKKKLNLE